MTPEVRRATPPDLPAVRTVLSRALADDPLFGWIFPTVADRPAAVAVFLASMVEQYVLAGTTWLAVDGDRAVGAAAWRVPGTEVTAPDVGDPLPGATLPLLEGPDHAATVRDGFGAMDALPDVGPSAYLHILGVDAGRRGQGIGRLLLDAGIDARPAGHAASLHTTVDANVRFYAGSGFTTAGTVRLGDRGPQMHLLVRPDGAATSGLTS